MDMNSDTTINQKKYDILELQKMELGELYNVALWNQVDTLNKPKQRIIYDILDNQVVINNAPFVETMHASSLRKKRVYLVAKVSGLDYREVKAKYEEARKIVEGYGHIAVIPTDHIPATATWHEAMRQAIPLMLSCDGYALVDEPHTTAGGLIEHTVATWLGFTKFTFTEFY